MEERMLVHVDDHVEIAGRTAAGARFAFVAQAKTLAARDARGNLHRQLSLLLHAPGAVARGARRADDRAAAAALTAGARHREKALLIPQLAAAVTLGARLRLRSRRRA